MHNPGMYLNAHPPPIYDRDEALLRALGRFEVLGSSWIKQLLFPDKSLDTAQRALKKLLNVVISGRPAQPLLGCTRRRTYGRRIAEKRPHPKIPAFMDFYPKAGNIRILS